uniref:Solute carrier organic anion transporter family member n=1 Tax=Schmidtea mediterranea TaxID=79327 RepID=A0A0H3YJ35_SCHMD|nr:slc21a-1 [Schmidtea mediterranea]
MIDNNHDITNKMSNVSKVHIISPSQPVKHDTDFEESLISHNNRCGILAWRPDCLQKFRSIYLFLLTMCVVCILQTALSAGYMSSQITTLERRFSLDSSMLGVIQSFFDVGFIVSVVFVGFLGGQGRIPLWIGCGMLIMSIGAFSFAIPEFITTYESTDGGSMGHIQLCLLKNTSNLNPSCGGGNKADWLVKFLFILGQILIGCGSSPVLSLGPTYIDDHVLPTVAPPLIALLYASSALGPVLGFGLGATMLRFPVNGKIVKGSEPGDSDWIGAWWGGYLCLGLGCAITAVFLFMFPKRVRKLKKMRNIKSLISLPKNNKNESKANTVILPKTQEIDIPVLEPVLEPLVNIKTNHTDKKPLSTPHSSNQEIQSSEVSRQMSNASIAKEYGKNLKDIPYAILSLLKNKIYIVVSLAICCEMFLVNGFAAFLPKYIENEYKVTNITSSLIAGGLIVPAGALGIIVGGLIMHRFQMSRRRAILFSIVAVIGVLVCLVLFFITGCQNPSFAGINTPLYYNSENYTSIDGKCVADNCASKCNPNGFSPVCDNKSGLTYFSPCYAGCKSMTAINDSKLYYNCSCTATTLNYQNPPTSLTAGECPLKCNSLITFVLFLTMALFLTGATQNPLLMVTMRSVQKHERAFALGFQFVILRLLAYIPSPIIYGTVIDAACVHWKRNCDERGDCLVTDLKLLNTNLIGLSFAVKSGAAIFYIILFFILPKHAHIMNPDSLSGTEDPIRDEVLIESNSNAEEKNKNQLISITSNPIGS